MKDVNLKKLIIPNIPYLLFVYLFDKVAQAFRLAPGADLSGKLLHVGDGFTAAFSSFAPSFDPVDLLVGVAGAVIIRLVIYIKGKNEKSRFGGMSMNRFTVEETNLISIYADSSKRELIENINAALPFMDADMRELAGRTTQKIDALTEAEYAELAAYAADEV